MHRGRGSARLLHTLSLYPCVCLSRPGVVCFLFTKLIIRRFERHQTPSRVCSNAHFRQERHERKRVSKAADEEFFLFGGKLLMKEFFLLGGEIGIHAILDMSHVELTPHCCALPPLPFLSKCVGEPLLQVRTAVLLRTRSCARWAGKAGGSAPEQPCGVPLMYHPHTDLID